MSTAMVEERRAPQRRCLVTRASGDADRMLRLVRAPDGQVLPDIDARLPGRGMWLSAERNVVNRAVAQKLFARAARAPVRVDPDLALMVERLLVRRFLDGLGLARRAGQVAAGFEKVRAWLQAEAAAVLIGAGDGADDGRAKLRRLASGLPVITACTRDELGAALGRDAAVHVAIAPGRLAGRIVCDAERLAGFRPGTFEVPEPRQALTCNDSMDTTGRP